MKKGNTVAKAPHILVIEARFYEEVSEYLAQGALKALEQAGASYRRLAVPGALEIPAVINYALHKNDGEPSFDAVVVLGCVIRGETAHYDIVCNESARGMYDLTHRHQMPLCNAVLTCETYDQSLERADPERKDKGGDAVKAALALLDIKRMLVK